MPTTSLRTFYTLLITQTLSLIGSRMTGVAIGLWVFAETGQAAPLLLAAFFAEVPSMAGGTFMGLLADRFDRRRVIMLGDAGQAAGTVLLLISVLSGAFQLWHLYAIMLLQGIFITLQEPAVSASVTLLVPERHLDRANGLREIGFNLAGVVAPVLAGLIYALAGLAAVVALDLLTFVVALVVIAALPIPRPPRSAEAQALGEGLWAQVLGGWRFLLRRPALLLMMLYLGFIFFLINGPLEMAIPYLSSITTDETLLGLLLGAMSLGALAGAALAAIGGVQQRMRVILAGYLGHGLLLIVYGLSRTPLLAGLTLFLLMAPLPLGGALFASLLQTRTPPDMQGRVFAVYNQIGTLITPFSFLLTAFLVDSVLEPAVGTPGWNAVAPLVGAAPGAGMGLLLVIVGVVIVAATLAVIAVPGIRRLEKALPDYSAETR